MTFYDLKEGMKVYIRDDLEFGKVYGNNSFAPSMVKGVCTVSSILKNIDSFTVNEDYSENYWKYTKEMVDWDRTEELNRTLKDIDELEDIDKVVETAKEILSIPYKPDAIKPSHYKLQINGNECEVRDVMQAVMTAEEYDGFLYGNILKYILRAKRKNGIEDMKKAKLYLEWLIEGREE